MKFDGLIDVLTQIPQVQIAILFGSASQDRMRPESDIDIAIAEEKLMSIERRIELNGILSPCIHKDVDLVDLRSAHGLLLSEILTKGTPLIIRDRNLYFNLIKENVYFNQDYLPLIKRCLEKRNRRFIFG
ncbi:MAG: nucleotidyltransferase domain-containing protein [Fibrobacter sp.]|nr:nucleotidyltransferase domain-containing protein [Fibrobacter sp.]